MNTVIITGAAGGLGKAFAQACAARGWPVLLTDLDEARLQAAAAGLRRQYGTEVDSLVCDMTDSSQRAAFWQALASRHLRAGMLINVAGLDFEGAMKDIEPEKLIILLRLNIEGTVDNMRRVLDLRAATEPLHILNVSSCASFQPMPIKAAYAASKRFLLDFSRAVRAEMKGSGITVTSLCPSGMPTNQPCIDSIASQGIMGLLTTRNVGDVAEYALKAALRGRSVVIPGFINRAMSWCAALMPKDLLASLIRRRWEVTRGRMPV